LKVSAKVGHGVRTKSVGNRDGRRRGGGDPYVK
jgi:hypothetical protein